MRKMLRVFLLLFGVAASAAGCGTPKNMAVETAAVNRQHKDIAVVSIGGNLAYLIDRRTESCFLTFSNPTTGASGMSPVSCAKLKRSTPEAAKHITWEEASVPAAADAAVTGPAAGQEPAAPPPIASPQ